MKKTIYLVFTLWILVTLAFPVRVISKQIKSNERIIVESTYDQQELDQSLNHDAIVVGRYDIIITNITDTHTITRDGDLSDWVGLPFGKYTVDYSEQANISLAYDDENIYIALQWLDSTLSNESIGYLTKTGMLNGTHASWDFVTGADDIVTFGFFNTTHEDGGTWTASNRTDDSHAWEFSDWYTNDAGILPSDVNSNYGHFDWYYDLMPIFDNSHTPIVDYASIPIGTNYTAYYPQTPTLSQTDYEIGWNWNETLRNGYSMEITRKLNTGNPDDVFLNFSLADHTMFIGIANGENTMDMMCSIDFLEVGITNKLTNFTFEIIPTPVTGNLLLKGVVQDDYELRRVEIKMSGWSEKYGPNYNWSTSINRYTGIWDEELQYNFDELPLGEQNITVTIYPLYEDPITLWQIIDVQDNSPPIITGVLDINSLYPNGVPATETNITIVAGVYDNYGTINLSVILYYSTNFGVNREVIMEPFSIEATTFNGEIPLPPVNVSTENPIYHDFTFYIMAKDLMNHTVYSENYSFIYPEKLQEVGTGEWLKLAYIIPSSVIGLGLIIVIPIILLKKKG